MTHDSMVETGLDRLARGDAVLRKRLDGKRVGLLAHAASVDRNLRHAVDVLNASGASLSALFGPEHGFFATAQDMIGVADARAHVPMYSLYGEHEADLAPKPEWLDGLDLVVIDLQDIGARYYTYVWTAAIMLVACARKGIPVLALDRPNPLGGVTVEGAPQREGYRSFVGYYPVSVRHGMTLGEVLTMVCALEKLPTEALEVVQMRGWQRAMFWEQTGLPWVLPSPNMPTVDTAVVYPGGCLLEATNLSEGRGTTRPFELWGAPFVDPEALARVQVDGAIMRPMRFEPTFHKWSKQVCAGVQPHVVDRNVFRPYETYLKLLAAVVANHADAGFAWRSEPYEFVSDRPAIDLLTGGPEYRTCIEQGASLDDVLEAERRGAHAFEHVRRPFLLYP